MERNEIIEKKISDNQSFTVEVGNIATYPVCVVNAANEKLTMGGGVDGAIHCAAGPELQEECMELGGCKTGEAKITKGYRLKARYVIHTPGPMYFIHEHPEKLLAGCYKNSLDLARKYRVHEIAFPAISTGVYAYPKREAAEIAVKTVEKWMRESDGYRLLVHFVCYNNRDLVFYQQVLAY